MAHVTSHVGSFFMRGSSASTAGARLVDAGLQPLQGGLVVRAAIGHAKGCWRCWGQPAASAGGSAWRGGCNAAVIAAAAARVSDRTAAAGSKGVTLLQRSTIVCTSQKTEVNMQMSCIVEGVNIA